jgi:hypothetical protein
MLSSRFVRTAALALGMLVPLTLTACTGFRPVYGDPAVVQQVELFYGSPANHYEQIVYEDLALRLGKATPGAEAPKLYVALRLSSKYLTSNTVGAYDKPRRMTVTARITLIGADGKSLFRGFRSESADFTTSQQVLGTDQAAADAAERASHALADGIRLTVLGLLAK